MKQKKSDKELILNKKTIATLENRQINAVYGGTCLTERCPICATGGALSCGETFGGYSHCIC